MKVTAYNLPFYEWKVKTLDTKDALKAILEIPPHMDLPIVVFGDRTYFKQHQIYANFVVFSPRYRKILEKKLKELCMPERDYIAAIKNLTFVSDGREVKTIKDDDPPWNKKYIKLDLLIDNTIATEFLPFVPKLGVLDSPLYPETFSTLESSDPLVILAYRYLYPRFSVYSLHILPELKDTALKYLEEKTGIERGKSYRELMRIARDMAVKTMKKKNIKPILKCKNRITKNPLVPQRIFPEVGTLSSDKLRKYGKDIPDDVEDQLAFIESLLDSPTKRQGGDVDETR